MSDGIVEDKMLAYSKYSEANCLPHMIQKMISLTLLEGKKCKVDTLAADPDDVVVKTERWLSHQPHSIQQRFVQAAQLVLTKNEASVQDNPQLLGLLASLPAARLFVNHILMSVTQTP